MEPIACGELALLPAAFYRLTPREFYLIWDGYRLRESNRHEELGWALATIVNYCSMGLKQAVSVETILGRPLRANLDAGLVKKDRARRSRAETEGQ